MSNIGNYSTPTGSTNYVKVSDNTQKVKSFAKYLHDFLPVLEKEFDDLEKRCKTHPNDVFPVKMEALSSIYKAAQPLYEWYVEKAKN